MTNRELNAIPTIGWIWLDTRNPEVLADWWSRLLGGGVVRTDQDGDAHLQVGPISLLFLGGAEPKSSKNRMHLDLRVNEYEEAIASSCFFGRHAGDEIIGIGRSLGIPKEMGSGSSDRNIKMTCAVVLVVLPSSIGTIRWREKGGLPMMARG